MSYNIRDKHKIFKRFLAILPILFRQRVERRVAAQEIEAGALQRPTNQLAVGFGVISARAGRVKHRRRDPRRGIRPLVSGLGEKVERVGVLEGRANAAQGLLPPAEHGVIAGEVLVDFRNAGVIYLTNILKFAIVKNSLFSIIFVASCCGKFVKNTIGY